MAVSRVRSGFQDRQPGSQPVVEESSEVDREGMRAMLGSVSPGRPQGLDLLSVMLSKLGLGQLPQPNRRGPANNPVAQFLSRLLAKQRSGIRTNELQRSGRIGTGY